MIQFDEHIFERGWFNHQLAFDFAEKTRNIISSFAWISQFTALAVSDCSKMGNQKVRGWIQANKNPPTRWKVENKRLFGISRFLFDTTPTTPFLVGKIETLRFCMLKKRLVLFLLVGFQNPGNMKN